ncbi:MAG: hypothetical protein QOF37_1199 [Thermoleophilaceae bacterium]|jgi:hypothetical protein|nr:hypothetical protein [Thermoleophilaceae bacterium]
MRGSHVIALVLAASLAPAPALAAKHKRKHRCAISGGSVALKSKDAVILSRDVAYSSLEDATEYYGCMRKKKRPFFIASQSSDQYGSSQIGPIALRGVFFAYALAAGDINNDCRASVTVVSIRTRHERYSAATPLGSGSFGSCPSVKKLAVSRRGPAAWTAGQGDQRFVRKLDSGGPGALDEGAGIDLSSLALTDDGVASWLNGGEPRTAQVH